MSESADHSEPVAFKDLPPQDGYEALTPENRERLSQTAMKLFIEASMKAPASVTAQGAIIAKTCQELGLTNPELLSECLVNDNDRLARLQAQAAKIHEKMGIGPKNIDDYMLEGVIVHDFRNAAAFMDHTPEELEYIAGDMRKKYVVGGFNRKGKSQITVESSYYNDALYLRTVREQRDAEKRTKELNKKQNRIRSLLGKLAVEDHK